MLSKQKQTYLSGAALTISCFLIVIVLLSCGGPKSGGERVNKSCVPSALAYVPMEHGVFLQWLPNCARSRATSGYNFYVTRADEAPDNFPTGAGRPHNRVPYPGDTDADRLVETAELKGLESGVEYVAVVRILFPDGSESKPSNVVRFSAMPGGEFSLAMRYQGDNDGFALARGVHVRADNTANDLYFMAKSSGDYLMSPSKLGFGLKTIRLSKVGTFVSLAEAGGAVSSGEASEEMKVHAGDLIELRTEDNHYARVYVKSFSGTGKARIVELQYLYQPTAGKKKF